MKIVYGPNEPGVAAYPFQIRQVPRISQAIQIDQELDLRAINNVLDKIRSDESSGPSDEPGAGLVHQSATQSFVA